MPNDNSWLKRLIGEEQIGKLTAQLLSNDKFMFAVQALVTKSLAARETVERSIKSALGAMNLPTTEDVEKLRNKVEGLEAVLSSVEKKVDALLEKKAG